MFINIIVALPFLLAKIGLQYIIITAPPAHEMCKNQTKRNFDLKYLSITIISTWYRSYKIASSCNFIDIGGLQYRVCRVYLKIKSISYMCVKKYMNTSIISPVLFIQYWGSYRKCTCEKSKKLVNALKSYERFCVML